VGFIDSNSTLRVLAKSSPVAINLQLFAEILVGMAHISTWRQIRQSSMLWVTWEALVHL
jgi:hypothetical protein